MTSIEFRGNVKYTIRFQSITLLGRVINVDFHYALSNIENDGRIYFQ